MRLEQLRSFVALHETSSFTAAAERLYTSQPVVTRHILQLEAELGCPLFIRTTRRVASTKAGDVFYEKAYEALALIDKGIAECKALHDENASLAIGCEYLYMDHHVTAWLSEFESIHDKKFSFSIVEQPAPQLFSALTEGKIDCVFIGLTKDEVIPAYLEKCCIVAMSEDICIGKTHPLAARESVSVNDLLDEDFVYPLSKPTSRESVVVRDFEEMGKPQRFAVILHQPSALKMVELGNAVIDFPAEYHIDNPNLIRIPYESDYQIKYYFVWNRGDNSEAFTSFRGFVEEKIRDLNSRNSSGDSN